MTPSKIIRNNQTFYLYKITSRSILYKNDKYIFKKCLTEDTGHFFQNFDEIVDLINKFKIFTQPHGWYDKNNKEYLVEYFESKIISTVKLESLLILENQIMEMFYSILSINNNGYTYSGLQLGNILVNNNIIKLCDLDAIKKNKSINIKQVWMRYKENFLQDTKKDFQKHFFEKRFNQILNSL